MKFIIGTLRFKPDTRDGLLAELRPHIEATRREEGNIFFELNPKMDKPDEAFLCECFVDDAAHSHHQTLPHFKELIACVQAVMEGGDVKAHFTDAVFDDN